MGDKRKSSRSRGLPGAKHYGDPATRGRLRGRARGPPRSARAMDPLEWRHGTAVSVPFITGILVAGGMEAMCGSCGGFSGLAMMNGLTSGRIREHRAPVACHGMEQNV